MCWVDPHGRQYHSEADCEYAERDLVEISDDLAPEYGYHPCFCAT